jgi:hypothetical protein
MQGKENKEREIKDELHHPHIIPLRRHLESKDVGE